MVDPTGLFITQILGGIAGAGESYQEAQGIREQGRTEAFHAEVNAGIARRRASDALARGEMDSTIRANAMRELEGAQRSAFAAQGVDVNVGTAAMVQAHTREQAIRDVLTIRENAYREAWGFEMDAVNYNFERRMAKAGAAAKARSTIVGGGLQFARGTANAAGTYAKNRVSTSGYKGGAGVSAAKGIGAGASSSVGFGAGISADAHDIWFGSN